jgi:hypothetical protein
MAFSVSRKPEILRKATNPVNQTNRDGSGAIREVMFVGIVSDSGRWGCLIRQSALAIWAGGHQPSPQCDVRVFMACRHNTTYGHLSGVRKRFQFLGLRVLAGWFVLASTDTPPSTWHGAVVKMRRCASFSRALCRVGTGDSVPRLARRLAGTARNTYSCRPWIWNGAAHCRQGRQWRGWRAVECFT